MSPLFLTFTWWKYISRTYLICIYLVYSIDKNMDTYRLHPVLNPVLHPTMCSRALLCALGLSHAVTEKDLPQTVPKLFGSIKLPTVSLCLSIKDSVNISNTLLKLRGLGKPLKNSPLATSLLHQILKLAWHSRAGNVPLAFAKPRLIHQTARQWSAICHSTKYKSTAPVAACCTTLDQTLGIVLCDVRLACSFWAIGTNAMKLPALSFSADVNAKNGLETAKHWQLFCTSSLTNFR